ncbi:hypothetical protein [Shinella sp.]|uniref:hypothetical protein n=1 Tax=Shinella sp. TaxID=1870904 RepID=UPI0029B4203F|nr:hypothetical protein [Shinella sp.]MDX3974883.1 hypothetical protein [Shinella sp.]
MNTEPLSLSERALLARLANTLIPPAPGCLSASEAGIAGECLDQALSYAPDLVAMLRSVIGAVGNATPQQALLALKQSDAAAYDAFCETIAAIYFLSPAVRAAVGFPGREPKPARVDVADLEDLLMPVLEAGFAPRAV